MPKVSVVVPSYNHEQFITASLQSVLDQSFQDFEIVVTDDGSRDRTVEVARSVSDRRISVEALGRNYGACIALNASIKRSTGEYVSLLNSDDIFLPQKLEKQVRFLDDHSAIAAVFAWPMFINELGDPYQGDHKDSALCRTRNQPRHAWLRHFFQYGNALCHPTVMIRRQCYSEIGLYNPALAQIPDLEMWIRLLGKYDIAMLEERLVGFRIRNDLMNASAARPEVVVRDQWEWQKVLKQYLKLDTRLLAEIFPELGLAQTRASKPGLAARLAGKVLAKYMGSAPPRAANAHVYSRRETQTNLAAWGLARMALAVGKPAHIVFAFDTMYEALSAAGDQASFREFIELTGKYDPFGVLSVSPFKRSIK